MQRHTPINNNCKLTSYAQDVLEGLKYVHSTGVIHDDIKLENILMSTPESEDEYNQAKLCDFGLSHIFDKATGKAKADQKCGTIGYMAPEI